jgi:hypothetical protein
MYVEQKITTCLHCGRPFAVQYAIAAERLPSHVASVTTVLSLTCPQDDCRRAQRMAVPLRIADVVVKWIPFLEPDHAPAV